MFVAGEGLYGGCLSDDSNTLRFTYFDVQGVLDLRCTRVNVLYIDNTPMVCGENFFIANRDVVVYLNDVMCVSIYL